MLNLKCNTGFDLNCDEEARYTKMYQLPRVGNFNNTYRCADKSGILDYFKIVDRGMTLIGKKLSYCDRNRVVGLPTGDDPIRCVEYARELIRDNTQFILTDFEMDKIKDTSGMRIRYNSSIFYDYIPDKLKKYTNGFVRKRINPIIKKIGVEIRYLDMCDYYNLCGLICECNRCAEYLDVFLSKDTNGFKFIGLFKDDLLITVMGYKIIGNIVYMPVRLNYNKDSDLHGYEKMYTERSLEYTLYKELYDRGYREVCTSEYYKEEELAKNRDKYSKEIKRYLVEGERKNER